MSSEPAASLLRAPQPRAGNPRQAAAAPEQPIARVNVKDFGAVGDGRHNDYGAFRRALAHLGDMEGARELSVPDGNYYLVPSNKAAAHVWIQGERDLTVRGGTSTVLLLGSAFHHGLVVSDSERVHIESLSLDYKPLPFTQGTITEVAEDAHQFVMQLDPGYPRATDRHMQADRTKRIVYLFRPGTTLLMTALHDQYIEDVEVLDPRRIRLTSRNPVTADFIGLRAAMVARRRADAVVFQQASACSATDVTVYSAPALGFGLRHTDGITLDRCRVLQAENSDRLLSTNADGIHVKWGKTGPKILGCHLEGMGDDGINIGGTYQRIHSRPDPHTLQVDFHRSLAVGGRLMLVRNRTGAMVRLPELQRVERLDDKLMVLHFAADLPAVGPVVQAGPAREANMVINLDQVAANAVLKDNFIGRNRMRGMIIHGPDAVIANNRFQDMLGPAIRVGHHYRGGKEGPNGSGAVIRDNTFINIQDSPIHLSDRLKDGDVTQRSIENVTISGNRLRGYGEPSVRVSGKSGCAIYIDNAQHVELEGNMIGRPSPAAPSVGRVLLRDVQDVALHRTLVAPGALVNDQWLGLGRETDSTTVLLQ